MTTSLSPPTINKIIHQDLIKETKKKSKVHKLSDENKKNRKTNSRKIYEPILPEINLNLQSHKMRHLSMNMKQMVRLKYATLFRLIEEKAYQKVGYSKKAKVLPEAVTVPLFRVPSSVKINAQYYVDYLLKPLFMIHLPRLYEYSDLTVKFLYT